MFIKTYGSAVVGVDAVTITVEVNWNAQGREYCIVGLPDSSIKESIQRIESAIKSNGFEMPRTRIVVNLAPADMRKSGTAFDLPIAIGILAASEQLVIHDVFSHFIMMGELSLDGELRSIRGALPIALQARRDAFKGFILPVGNSREAALVEGIDVFGMKNLKEVVQLINTSARSSKPVKFDIDNAFSVSEINQTDFADVRGQENIKRALEIAASGGHNVILIGPPGAGKTMLAKRLPSILPPLTMDEAIESTKIYSVAGKLPDHATLITQRPFRNPHHTTSSVALIGGGGQPQPGEVSLSHNGVLFLDELPEFQRHALEVMRQPMEERKATVSRARQTIEFPASFMLIASMNPCPCGYYNHPTKSCTCPPGAVNKYLNKISGPLLDRIDLHVEVTPIPFDELSSDRQEEKSKTIRERVEKARIIQTERFRENKGMYANAQMGQKELKRHCLLDKESHIMLKKAMEKFSLSARAYDRILKVSRTIADLDQSEKILSYHLAESILYRSLDREGWGG